MTARKVDPGDLMDSAEVAAAYGCATSSLRVALTKPDTNPRLARSLPAPLRKIGGQWVWTRYDIERALKHW